MMHTIDEDLSQGQMFLLIGFLFILFAIAYYSFGSIYFLNSRYAKIKPNTKKAILKKQAVIIFFPFLFLYDIIITFKEFANWWVNLPDE